MISKEILTTKNKIHDKMKSIIDFNAVWEYDSETKRFKLIIEGIYMEKGMGPSGLTAADKEWIASLIQTAVKPINERLANIENRLDVIEKDVKAIKECPTIQKELKKDDE